MPFIWRNIGSQKNSGVQTTPMTRLLRELQKDPDPRVRDAAGESMQALGLTPGKAAEILPVSGRD